MSGELDRRTFLATVPAIAVLGLLKRGRRQALTSAGLNHAVLDVTDPERSLEFYQELLGMPIQARRGDTTILRIGDGPQHLAIRRVTAGTAPAIGRMGIAIRDFDAETIGRALVESGVTWSGAGTPSDRVMRLWTSEGTSELFLGDPHGITVQLVDPTYCGGSGALGNICGSPEPAPSEGRIQVRDLNHFTSSVSDPSRAAAFYEEVFGITPQVFQAATPALDVDGGGPQFLMFSGGGGGASSGQSPQGSINHLCMTTEGFDTEGILSTLSDFGIRSRAEGESANVPLISYVSMRMPNRGGAPGGTPELYFTDPDGLRIQLQDTTYCGGGGVLGSVC